MLGRYAWNVFTMVAELDRHRMDWRGILRFRRGPNKQTNEQPVLPAGCKLGSRRTKDSPEGGGVPGVKPSQSWALFWDADCS